MNWDRHRQMFDGKFPIVKIMLWLFPAAIVFGWLLSLAKRALF
jgi:hypothetical protein